MVISVAVVPIISGNATLLKDLRQWLEPQGRPDAAPRWVSKSHAKLAKRYAPWGTRSARAPSPKATPSPSIQAIALALKAIGERRCNSDSDIYKLHRPLT
jgi:hypothetical protein